MVLFLTSMSSFKKKKLFLFLQQFQLNSHKTFIDFNNDLVIGEHIIIITHNKRFMVFNATFFNNISAISRRSVLLMEETGGPVENHRPVTIH